MLRIRVFLGKRSMNRVKGPSSPIILKNGLSLVLQIFFIETFECNTTSNWLNHTISPIKSCVTFNFANLDQKDKGHFFKNGG